MAKTNGSRFECGECGWGSAKWLGRCGGCGSWDSLTVVATGGLDDRRVRAAAGVVAPPQAICDVAAATAEAWATGVEELDRVLGGGIVPGSAVLVGGEPGVGKSTLLLDVAARAAAAGRRVLYVSGEESVAQVAARGRRIGATHPGLKLGAVNELTAVKALIASERPELLIVDSIQTVVAPELDGTPGGVTHLRAVTSTLVTAAKACDMACLLVGHVTKDGSVAGPRTLEHLVDAVLLFEGDRNSALRWLRATKNRFGSAEEVGCFEMEEDGVKGVNDP
ncbi:MAG: AAA family ATPase, partial [Bifidobacteriaceae bacterium]|nr:AAA family ATPase [Bifidobacteriaceae bacterium]